MIRTKAISFSGAFFAVLLSIQFTVAQARTYQVFEVRKNIPMNSDETIYHDYYINAGSSEGLKVGAVILVKRRLPVHNPYTDSNEDMYLPVAHLQLIHVQKNVSVGRIIKSYSPKENALVESHTVMAGDLIDVISNGDDEGQTQGSKGSEGSSKPNKKDSKEVARKDNLPEKQESAPAPVKPKTEHPTESNATEDGSLFPKENHPLILSQ